MKAVLEPIDTDPDEVRFHAKCPSASLHEVTKRYSNGVVALDRVSLELRNGEIVALLGPNGAGKSTAVKLMMGLTSPTEGEVRVFGGDPRFAGNRLRTGVMLQVGRAPEMLRVREHVEIMRGYYPRPLPFSAIVHAAGLEGIEERMFGQLSGGQKQRVLFALALAGDPDLIFLDEPTVGLDIEARRTMWAEIRSLRARGKTVLLTTHYLEEADALADQIIVLNKGRVICKGSPAEVRATAAGQPSSPAHGDSQSQLPDTRLLSFQTQLSREQILNLAGVQKVEASGGGVIVTTSAPERTLRELLALDPELRGLDVRTPALEDAFLTLTTEK
ncbi:MAG TPA: ABC transporter ATP-binding protein [Acidobacteriaceae bacterium]|nr:ABC transporter ATP-binding protein [Acidobacteriaceae bacterium]